MKIIELQIYNIECERIFHISFLPSGVYLSSMLRFSFKEKFENHEYYLDVSKQHELMPAEKDMRLIGHHGF